MRTRPVRPVRPARRARDRLVAVAPTVGALATAVVLALAPACGSESPAMPADGGVSDDAALADPDTAVNPPGPDAGACSAATCAGCCRDGVCLSGATPTACGKPGQACESCSGATDCVDRACKLIACGPDNCAGCCRGAACVAGDKATECGGAGQACVECEGRSACNAGACIAISCQASCTSGCCAGSACNPGNVATACGKGGNACTVCGGGRACVAGACAVDPSRPFDLVMVSAVVPATNKAGAAWDLGGGLPDPYAVVKVGARTGQTLFAADTATPTWGAVVLASVPARELQAPITLELWDDDVTVDDFLGGCTLNLTDAVFDGALHNGSCAASTTGAALTYTYKLVPK